MAQYKSRVDLLRRDWITISGSNGRSRKRAPTAPAITNNSAPGRLPPGIITPLESYYIPILTALSEAGGTARASAIVHRVGEILRNQLSEADLMPLPGNPAVTRWCNRAHWARLKLVKAGLLRKDVPHGIWEIADAGRAYLASKGNPSPGT